MTLHRRDLAEMPANIATSRASSLTSARRLLAPIVVRNRAGRAVLVGFVPENFKKAVDVIRY